MIDREHHRIPIELVDEPDAPTRMGMDIAPFDDLVASIREHGQLQPGGVVPNGARFTVSYGHRRLLACRALQLPVYLAYVYESDTVAMLGAQLAENVDRADLNPVEEAHWFAQIMDAAQWDCDELALRLKRTRAYVEDRLNLHVGDPRVMEALGRGQIGLTAAKYLNAYADAGDRLVLLDAAIHGGASARLVAQWIADRRQVTAARGGAPLIDPAATPADQTFEGPKPLTCLYCDSDEEVYNMHALWIHKSCLRLLSRILANQTGGFHDRLVAPAAETRPRGPAPETDVERDRVAGPARP